MRNDTRRNIKKVPDADIQAILDRLKRVLKSRGIRGIIGLGRAFRTMDEDGNHSLSLAEFTRAIHHGGLDLTDREIRLLFEHFDVDHSKSIDFNEFLVGVRDPMDERRLALVRQAFRLMDKDNNGVLEVNDIVEAYDASRHPDVISGKKTPEQVFREFLDTFDVDNLHTGKITPEEWEHYYANVSASIDDDDYFELMMRNSYDGNGTLNHTEFRRALEGSELELSGRDIQVLFEYFDTDHSGSIDFNEFLAGVRDPMNARRLSLVRQAFRLIDKDNNGLLEPQDIVQAYDASQHPDVLSGHKKEEDVFREFLDTFDVDGLHTGSITPEEWEHYYNNISSSIPDDDYFELMMRNAWHISGGSGVCENSSNRRVLVRHKDGRTTIEEIEHDLGLHSYDTRSIINHLRLQGIEAQSVQLFDGQDIDAPDLVAGHPDRARRATNSENILELLRHPDATVEDRRRQGHVHFVVHEGNEISKIPTGPEVVQYVRQAVQHRSLEGLSAIRRNLMTAVGESNSGFLLPDDVRRALADDGVVLRPEVVRNFVQMVSRDENASATVNQVMRTLNGPLSPASTALVQQIYRMLQRKSSNRVLTPYFLAEAYDANNHPDVRFEGRTAEQVFEEFISSFDLNDVDETEISYVEFEEFCRSLKACTGDEEYFCTILTSVFHE